MVHRLDQITLPGSRGNHSSINSSQSSYSSAKLGQAVVEHAPLLAGALDSGEVDHTHTENSREVLCCVNFSAAFLCSSFYLFKGNRLESASRPNFRPVLPLFWCTRTTTARTRIPIHTPVLIPSTTPRSYPQHLPSTQILSSLSRLASPPPLSLAPPYQAPTSPTA